MAVLDQKAEACRREAKEEAKEAELKDAPVML
jgi:hypothetical protein